MSRTTLTRTAVVAGAVGALALTGAGPASAETEVPEPATFTSAFTAMATPDMVVNPDGVATPGEPGASGTFTYRINSDTEVICYDITLDGVTPPYQSPAKTRRTSTRRRPGRPARRGSRCPTPRTTAPARW